MKEKTKWVVLALPNDDGKMDFPRQIEIGKFTTKRAAEEEIFKQIPTYNEFGMALVKVGMLDEKFEIRLDAWNYTTEKGKVYYRRNHHDLW